MKLRALTAVALCLALGACTDLAVSVVCPSDPQPSVIVGVLDAATQESVADDAYGWWSAGIRGDSLRHVRRAEGMTHLAAFGPAGVYQVRVQRPGHPDWVQSNVVVGDSECGPATVRLTAALQAM